jgi:hypothetical protein
MEFQSIEPAVLAALAEKAMQEENRMQNPYLKALMVRLSRLALELKAALEKEGGADQTQPCSGKNSLDYESTATKQDTDPPPPVHASVVQGLDDLAPTEGR